VPEKLPNSIQDVVAGAGAPLIAAALETLKDIDAQRISSDDAIVIRKGVYALFAVVAELEGRVGVLERALAARTP
jgi:hypothetical protein